MKELPILFSAPMVRAILAGTKTQTRRVAKLDFDGDTDADGWPLVASKVSGCLVRARSPYGVAGDRLWVRENCWLKFCQLHHGFSQAFGEIVEHSGDAPCGHPKLEYPPPEDGEPPHVWFAADGPLPAAPDGTWWARRNSIHMPRWASRITLEVTDVRVERLQDISEDDARAEGFPLPNPQKTRQVITHPNGRVEKAVVDGYFFDARGNFCATWQALNGKRAPWASNPWVWAVSFKVTP